MVGSTRLPSPEAYVAGKKSRDQRNSNTAEVNSVTKLIYPS